MSQKSILLQTPGEAYRKGRSVNATNTSFASIIPTVTEPKGDAGTATGNSVIDCLNGAAHGAGVPNAVKLVFYGTGNDDTTFSVRLIGWNQIGDDVNTNIWVPIILAEFGCTLSATVGIAGRTVVATERFVDTISVITGNAGVGMDVVSPTAEEIASAVIDLKGAQKIELSYDMTGATGANALVSFL